MKTEQRLFSGGKWEELTPKLTEVPQLVLAFGGTTLVKEPTNYTMLKEMYPQSHILLCSTAGEILGERVHDNTLSVTALYFANTTLQFAQASIGQASESQRCGEQLAEMLPKEGLVHVLVFSDGLKVNGTALVNGLVSKLPPTITVTGGLVGDGSAFKETYTGLDSPTEQGKVVAIGLYGSSLRIGYGSLGGWDPFGVERRITRAKDNVLYELDCKPALALYKEYLGEQAADLPASGLLFPLSLHITNDTGRETEIVRTLLSVNEAEQSMTFAGDMPEGVMANLMKANFDRLIDGASGAASMSIQSLANQKAQFALLISCIGRKLVLKERIEEELEAVRMVVGDVAAMTGFYSYGELCPVAATEKQCQLHNQTMTITTLSEV